MLHSPCAQLSRLAKLLREKYGLQLALIASDPSTAELLYVEHELLRINRLITHHRQGCPRCMPPNELTIALPILLRQLAHEASAFPLAVD